MSGINMDLIKNKLNTLQTSDAKSTLIWKPTYEAQTIRIIPYKHNPEFPFIELYFYYIFGNRSILSPVSFGRRDPIMEFAENLKASGDKEKWKLGRKLEPKMRTYAPIIVRGSEDEGAKFWGFGKTVYQALLGYMSDADYGDITDVETGTDLTVIYEKKDGKDWPDTILRPKRNTSQMVDNAELMKKIITETPAITDIYAEKSFDELEAILDNWLKGGNADDEEESSAPSSSASSNSSDSSSDDNEEAVSSTDKKPVSDISSAFDDLFSKK